MTRDEKIRLAALDFVKNPTWWGRMWFQLRWQLDPPEDIMEWVAYFSGADFWKAEEEAGRLRMYPVTQEQKNQLQLKEGVHLTRDNVR